MTPKCKEVTLTVYKCTFNIVNLQLLNANLRLFFVILSVNLHLPSALFLLMPLLCFVRTP